MMAYEENAVIISPYAVCEILEKLSVSLDNEKHCIDEIFESISENLPDNNPQLKEYIDGVLEYEMKFTDAVKSAAKKYARSADDVHELMRRICARGEADERQ